MLGRMRIERLCVPMTDGRVESSTASERGITAVIVERHPFSGWQCGIYFARSKGSPSR